MTFTRKYPYEAVWLSATSISDFDKCSRLYYLRNVYKDPKTYRKIQVVNPYMTLGIAVHAVINNISNVAAKERQFEPLIDKFEEIWIINSGKRGGFSSPDQEQEFKERGISMIKRIISFPGPLKNLTNKIHSEVPNMWLSEKDLLVLCGVIDWIEILPDDTLHIIDFKTGKNDEDGNSLQLGIYLLIAKNILRRQVSKMSYWYLDREDIPRESKLPQLEEVPKILIRKGIKMKEYRLEGNFICQKRGCRYCNDYEAILEKKAEFVGIDYKMKRDLYYLSD